MAKRNTSRSDREGDDSSRRKSGRTGNGRAGKPAAKFSKGSAPKRASGSKFGKDKSDDRPSYQGGKGKFGSRPPRKDGEGSSDKRRPQRSSFKDEGKGQFRDNRFSSAKKDGDESSDKRRPQRSSFKDEGRGQSRDNRFSGAKKDRGESSDKRRPQRSSFKDEGRGQSRDNRFSGAKKDRGESSDKRRPQRSSFKDEGRGQSRDNRFSGAKKDRDESSDKRRPQRSFNDEGKGQSSDNRFSSDKKPRFRKDDSERPFKARGGAGSSFKKGKDDFSPRRPSKGDKDSGSSEKKSGYSSDRRDSKKSFEPRGDRPGPKKFSSDRDERPRKRTERKGSDNQDKSSSEKYVVDTQLQTEKIRLNRYISNSGICSRREADELITMGLISVNGKTITEMGFKVNPGDEVRYEDRLLKAERPVYLLLNKPKGFLTTTSDPQERNTVMQLVANAVKERVYPVGRLDRNTTGLLLLTNDGDLADKLMHPSYNVKKIYKVELDRPLTKGDFQKIQEGVQLEEGKAMVDDVAIVSEDGKTVGVELHIGWNRVVRRIFETLEYEVVKLDRSVYAGLDKKDLPRGHWRFLKKEEIIRLKHYK